MNSFSRLCACIAVMLSLVGCASVMKPTAVVHTDVIVEAHQPVAVVKEDAQPTVNEVPSDVVAVPAPVLESPFLGPPAETVFTVETVLNEKDVECLARNIYYEARGEGIAGMSAVGYVTVNRTEAKGFPSTICGVVHDKRYAKGRTFCQFSWVCKRPKGAVQPASYQQAREVAIKVLQREIRNPIGKALYFHERSIRRPSFAQAHNYVASVGNHKFFSAP